METFNKPTYPRPDFARESWESLDRNGNLTQEKISRQRKRRWGQIFEEKIQCPSVTKARPAELAGLRTWIRSGTGGNSG